MLAPLPPTFATTRDALHAVAEHVLAAALHRATGRIGLRATPGGFGTPPFGDDEVVRIEASLLVHSVAGEERRAPITSLRAAGDFVGVPIGAPPLYAPATPADPDRPLAVDAPAAIALARWYACAAGLLEELRGNYGAARPTLWPEHFDLATTIGEANYGASPGDATIAEPYLYVGPWDQTRRTGMFAAYPWGAAVTYSELLASDDPRAAGCEFFGNAAAALG